MPKKPTPAPKTVKPDQIILAIDRRRDAVLDVIRAARERLLISMFRCTDVPVLDAIAEALNRKVDVRLLITPRARGWQKRLKELGAYLESMGAKVHPYSDPVVKYHAKYVLADDGYPQSTNIDGKLLIGYGANADRYETWLPSAFPTKDTQQPFPPSQSPADPNVRNKDVGHFIAGQVPGDQAVHTATDIPLSAYGLGSHLFHGVFDNTDVFFKLGQAAVGGTD